LPRISSSRSASSSDEPAPRALDDPAKRRRVAHGDVGQDLAIEPDLGFLEAGDERAVRDAVLADGGVDPDDPELAKLALALLAVTGRVGERVEQRLARRLDQARPRALTALGVVQEALVALVGRDAPFDSCHELACS
jgi:hypothetical protein